MQNAAVENAELTVKVDHLVTQMDRFSRKILKYMDDEKNECKDEDDFWSEDDSSCSRVDINDLLTTESYQMLRDYQLYGIKWLMSLHTSGLNGIIADEMGLGKTLQIIKFLTALKSQTDIKGPHLMVGPLSVLSNWYKELLLFAPGEFDVLVHYGDKKDREEELYRKCSRWRKVSRQQTRGKTKIAIILTTYTLALNDVSLLKQVGRMCGKPNNAMDYLIVDEAHRIKNKSCLLYNTLKQIPLNFYVLLTGTPMQNNLQELWSLLRFLVPSIFPNHDDIHDWFNQPFAEDETIAVKAGGEISESAEITSDVESSETSMKQSERNKNTKASKTTPRSGSKSYQRMFQAKTLLSGASSLNSTTNMCVEDKEKVVASLHRVLKPFILRRMKVDVAIDIPPKVMKVIKCPLSPLQIALMNTLRSFVASKHQEALHLETQQIQPQTVPVKSNLPRYVTSLLQDSVHDTWMQKPNSSIHISSSGSTSAASSSSATKPSLSSLAAMSMSKTMMAARKLCNHPFLLMEDLVSIPDDLYFAHVLAASGKCVVLDKVLRHLMAKGSKVLIFSQFTSTLNILETLLSLRGWTFFRIDGNTDQSRRQRQIDAFSRPSKPKNRVNRKVNANKATNGHRMINMDEDSDGSHSEDESDTANEDRDNDTRIFLLTTPSGGVGINLQAADTVILFDQDWNPQQDLQAISRAHRIGQTKPVLVLRLVSEGPDPETYSIEERMLQRAAKKLRANREILRTGVFATAALTNTQQQQQERKKRLKEGHRTKRVKQVSGGRGSHLYHMDRMETEDDANVDDEAEDEDDDDRDEDVFEDVGEVIVSFDDDEDDVQGDRDGLADEDEDESRDSSHEQVANAHQWQSIFSHKKALYNAPIYSYADNNHSKSQWKAPQSISNHHVPPSLSSLPPHVLGDCCRGSFALSLTPPSSIPSVDDQIVELQDDGGDDNDKDAAALAVLCDRSTRLQLNHHHHTSDGDSQSLVIDSHDCASRKKRVELVDQGKNNDEVIELLDDDFVEIHVTFAPSRALSFAAESAETKVKKEVSQEVEKEMESLEKIFEPWCALYNDCLLPRPPPSSRGGQYHAINSAQPAYQAASSSSTSEPALLFPSTSSSRRSLRSTQRHTPLLRYRDQLADDNDESGACGSSIVRATYSYYDDLQQHQPVNGLQSYAEGERDHADGDFELDSGVSSSDEDDGNRKKPRTKARDRRRSSRLSARRRPAQQPTFSPSSPAFLATAPAYRAKRKRSSHAGSPMRKGAKRQKQQSDGDSDVDEDLEEYEEEPEEESNDRCVLCGQAGLGEDDFCALLLQQPDLLHQLLQLSHTPSVPSYPQSDADPTDPIVVDSSHRPNHSQSVATNTNADNAGAVDASAEDNAVMDLDALVAQGYLERLLLCDGCDGAYHLVCVGLCVAPKDDWFCALCTSTAMLNEEVDNGLDDGVDDSAHVGDGDANVNDCVDHDVGDYFDFGCADFDDEN